MYKLYKQYWFYQTYSKRCRRRVAPFVFRNLEGLQKDNERPTTGNRLH